MIINNKMNVSIEPDYIFETSWEVCNKIGGIHTVLSTKAKTIKNKFEDKYIVIGPDIWRETSENPEFSEEYALFSDWKEQALSEGLRIKIGRWNIAGNPIAILVDFTTFISEKNEIFKSFWEKYNLDSISGGWDYIESALFGYASAKVIESFTNYYIDASTKIIAHFHEWMTGTGVLYLKDKLPQIATVFTTHATVIGRSIAGNGFPLYENLNQLNGDHKAKEFNIISKQSLEKTAAKLADSFTTVSDLTGKECKQFLGRKVDIVTPNGFEDDFVPTAENFGQKRNQAKEKFAEVASAVLNENIPEDSFFIGISGRYEFKNKGIDLFIKALGEIKKSKNVKRKTIAFVLIPANHYGADKLLVQKLANKNTDIQISENYLTHKLHDKDYDPVLHEISKSQIDNGEDSSLKIIFVPSYLNGSDGIFNMSYFDLLIGLDLTIFPSYYEPWGYTPLESLCFSVPTITTTLAGFGLWVNDYYSAKHSGITVINRNDSNDNEVVEKIAEKILYFRDISDQSKKEANINAFDVSRIALWKNLIKYYFEAYSVALEKITSRKEMIKIARKNDRITGYVKRHKSNKPVWKKLIVKSHIPKKLAELSELSKNLWWSWDYEAQELFEYIDEKLWQKCEKNPLILLEEIPYERLKELENDDAFILKYESVISRFTEYLNIKPSPDSKRIAYFSMEYGLHNSLKIFSGGLGILAGDYLKEASDTNVNMTAIGLLYRYGYFGQKISLHGEQIVNYHPQHFSHLPIIPVKDENGNWKKISVAFPGRNIYAKIWQVNIGRIKLYLLDTDIIENYDDDKKITHHLYGGDNEFRFMQEMLLGIGGMRALNTINIQNDIYHCNEGHAAFIGLERLKYYINEKKLTFAESVEIVRASTLFTTHTPVPAGHDSFPEDLVRTYMSHYPARLQIDWETFMNLGKINSQDQNEKFSMSYLAANLSQEINGVSRLHGEVSQKMFNPLWDGYYPEELALSYVTNGVHYQTWTAKEWQKLYSENFENDFLSNQSDPKFWSKIHNVDDRKIWEIRSLLRKKLIEHAKSKINRNWTIRHENPQKILEVLNKMNDKVLTIGFARRFATYKRGTLLFKNIERLSQIVNNPKMPVQIIFAGKAHPNDGGGQDLIKRIVEVSRRPEFLGKILFLENYDIELAKKLVQGVDIWLNTPTRPLEASGTSGMKAIMNGVMNFSVLDGWWVEGFRENAGWAVPEERIYADQNLQDELDVETIYRIFEDDLIPLFYERNENNIPEKWINRIKNSIAQIAPEFTTKRMIDDYQSRFYEKLYERSNKLKINDFELAYDISVWKKRIEKVWDKIQIESISLPDTNKAPLVPDQQYSCKVELKTPGLSAQDIGLEIVVAEMDTDNEVQSINTQEFEYINSENSINYYELKISPKKSGMLNFGIRIFPKNELLPHRQDFSTVRWI
ncbi:MAG: alpha-glucan family phosphorylase [Bacteroidetes bacterium]|jgi:glycogen phosphorylase/synthase|nr:alpha-glucan family phosphorylase [Bacteroidota bacterium]MBT6684942.1 alpha-glucan family phosphorylase [Bacteroidota bacterium]MBT7145247.1 alpha-glucan family phosphorylase [Bacteroidota bacterium]MBT7493018.1 alpha-glucan family phosphorylase [Bacteroidota bacterium]